MKHVKTFEGRNNYHFFYNFNSSYNLKEIYNIVDKLEEKNIDYKMKKVKYLHYFCIATKFKQKI